MISDPAKAQAQDPVDTPVARRLRDLRGQLRAALLGEQPPELSPVTIAEPGEKSVGVAAAAPPPEPSPPAPPAPPAPAAQAEVAPSAHPWLRQLTENRSEIDRLRQERDALAEGLKSLQREHGDERTARARLEGILEMADKVELNNARVLDRLEEQNRELRSQVTEAMKIERQLAFELGQARAALGEPRSDRY